LIIELPEILNQGNCRRFGIAPVMVDGRLESVLIDKKADFNILSMVKFCLGRDIDFVPVEADLVMEALNRTCRNSANNQGRDAEIESHRHSFDPSVVSLIDDIITDALTLTASDIHLEPFETSMAVRIRVDGILRQRRIIRKETTAPVISRVKIMSGLDIAEKRRPQDGRLRFRFQDRTVDIRVSVLPTDFGEKIVLRLLDKATLKLSLDRLGFDAEYLALFKEKLHLPGGIILITGPTGSGKTTTLYAALNHIKSPDINITTIEDPIEYNLDGINQTQIKPAIGLTFAGALRAILRQDPNVIMVGEIRDRETLEIALRASLTGHLVFSTLHTNDASSSIARLIDLGAENYLLATTLKLVVAQRLVRRICPRCQTNRPDPVQEAAAARLDLPPGIPIRRGRGCDNCLSTGYRGRTVIYEMLAPDEKISRMIYHGADPAALSAELKKNGMKTMSDRGCQLIKDGQTTPSEVLRETC